MNPVPRVAFFTDCYHEVNGVALTSRELEAYARRSGHPFLTVRRGPAAALSAEVLELQRSRLSFAVDRELCFDLLFWRLRRQVEQVLAGFRPDLVHVTSPGDLGILGAWMAHRLGIPLVASWHTNLHEYAGRRLAKLLCRLPGGVPAAAGRAAERLAASCVTRFYGLAHLLLVPNPELASWLRQATGRPALTMSRGVRLDQFSPGFRDREDATVILGYVGRLTPEKNVRLLARLEQAMRAAGLLDYRILAVGDGDEKDWLRRNLLQADLPGVLRGQALSRAYANMDVFVFPSETDTYGNAVQEALASGVPAVVTSSGGPKFLVQSGVTGFVAVNEDAFARCTLELVRSPELRRRMSDQARESARRHSWDAVFQGVYKGYGAVCDGFRNDSCWKIHHSKKPNPFNYLQPLKAPASDHLLVSATADPSDSTPARSDSR